MNRPRCQVEARCKGCQRPLTETGPYCEFCSAWVSNDAIYSQAMVDAKVAEVWIMARMEVDAAVAHERERCAKIAEECRMTQPSFFRPIARRRLEPTRCNNREIAARIREGK